MDNLRKHIPFTSKGSSQSESRSVFHVTTDTFSVMKNCGDVISKYIEMLNQFCSAGSQLAKTFSDVFQNTQFSKSAGQFLDVMSQIEMATGHTTVEEKTNIFQVLEELVLSVDKDPSQSIHSEDSLQSIRSCFSAIVQLHCQFIATSAEMLTSFSNKNTEITCASLTKDAKPSMKDIRSNQHFSKVIHQEDTFSTYNKKDPLMNKKVETVKVKKGNSSFYVDLIDLNDEAGTSKDQLKTDETKLKAHALELDAGTTGFKDGATPDPCANPPLINIQGPEAVISAEAEMVSQDELDNVIDFLSKCHKPPPCMQSIPEDDVPYTNHHFSGNEGVDDMISQQADVPITHRRSSSLVEEILSHNERGPVWPNPIKQRSSFPRDASVQQDYFPSEPSTADLEFSHYLSSIQAMSRGSPGGTCVGNGQYQPWPQSSRYNQWQTQQPLGYEVLTKSWHAGHESSSTSDDQSSNGEASVSTDNVAEKSRRHSSAEGMRDGRTIHPPIGNRHRSLDDLVHDNRSKMWPACDPGMMPGNMNLLERGRHSVNVPALVGQAGLPGGQAALPGGQAGLPRGQAGLLGGQAGLPEGQAGLPGGQAGLPGGHAGLSGGQYQAQLAMQRGDHSPWNKGVFKNSAPYAAFPIPDAGGGVTGQK
ncbi:unnamed protein product [Owenia fusiformis]|uniref:DUF4745 domain-containing protein n=1 Tax=Owenia fusiformis TaxID=6347 RepID=A0A8S4NH82_OWEFU|nr:unnamed protein product [Owenia fusiformis]